jgi:asparaginyl-tRNA synthetase
MGQRIKIKALLQSGETGTEVTVKGWVRAFRQNRFIALNDGSTNSNLQIVVDFENTDPALLKRITFGAAVSINRHFTLIRSGPNGEVIAARLRYLAIATRKVPLQPKKSQSLEFLRENAHLRFRTNTFGAIFRVRNTLVIRGAPVFPGERLCVPAYAGYYRRVMPKAQAKLST